MTFNHYAKIKRILEGQPSGWYIKRIDKPTKAKKFNGETVSHDHYYRVYDAAGNEIKYCKFQKIDKFASIIGLSVQELPIVS